MYCVYCVRGSTLTYIMHRRRKTRRWYSTTETAVSSAWKTAIVVNHANCWVDYSRRYAGTSATFPHDDKCWAFIKWMENNFHLNHSFWFIWLNAGKCGWGQSSALFVVYCQLARVLFFLKKRVTHTIEEGKGWWASIMIVFPARKKKCSFRKKKKKAETADREKGRVWVFGGGYPLTGQM